MSFSLFICFLQPPQVKMMIQRVFSLRSPFILSILETLGRLYSQTVALTIFIFVPFQSDAYLRVYLRILANIEHSSPQRTLWRRRLTLLGLAVRLRGLQFFYLLFFPSQTEFDTFLAFDIIDFLIPNVSINIVAFLFAILPTFFNQRLFFHAEKQLIEHLISVLQHNSTDWFLNPIYKGKAICPLLCRLYATIFNLQSTYQLFFEILFVSIESYLLCSALPHLTAFSLAGHCLAFAGYLLVAINFAFITCVAFSILFTLLAMFHIKMWQIYRKLKERPLPNRKWIHIKKQFLSTFLFFLRINAMYRWIFATFLLSAVPLNLLLTLSLLLRRISSESFAFAAFLLYYTFLFIFAFHLAFAYPSKAIHRFGPLFQHTLVCTHPTTGKTRTRIRLSHLIFAFHVPAKDRYGFNYGNWGLVSLENFLKYLLIYGKLTMVLYKLLN